jgi:polysaccharide deacetylase family protein (PEP-CTERM system associated)
MTQRLNDASSKKSILITVDLEDWFQVENLRPCYPHDTWGACELRVEKNTHLLLDLFDRHNIQATFFVLGWIAEHCPELIRNIQSRGHEIASHGYRHQLCSELHQSALYEDLHHSKILLEEIIRKPVLGYRAPNFSITKELVDALGDLGFKYDSSYNSFGLNRRHGRADGLFSLSSNNHLVAKNELMELPMSNLTSAGHTIPWSGGGYFRFWPSTLFHAGVSRILKHDDNYMFYCHPWEIDAAQPRANGIGALSRFRHYFNLDQTLNRLDRFFTRFKGNNFVSCSQYLKL